MCNEKGLRSKIYIVVRVTILAFVILSVLLFFSSLHAVPKAIIKAKEYYKIRSFLNQKELQGKNTSNIHSNKSIDAKEYFLKQFPIGSNFTHLSQYFEKNDVFCKEIKTMTKTSKNHPKFLLCKYCTTFISSILHLDLHPRRYLVDVTVNSKNRLEKLEVSKFFSYCHCTQKQPNCKGEIKITKHKIYKN